MSMMFPFLAYLVICKPFKYARILGLITTPLILDSVLRFNSRGAFLGMAVAGLMLLVMARGKTRLHAFYAVALGILAFLYQAQDPKIWERLFSIGASQEERDASAEHRIESWKAGMQMIADYPFGSGGRSAFISPRGNVYIEHLGYNELRSVHNGFISIAAGWGVQGFMLVTAAFGIAMGRTWMSIGYFQRRKNEKMVFLGTAILGAFFGQCTCAMFGDYYDGEWFLWLAGYGLVYATFEQSEREAELDRELYGEEEDLETEDEAEDFSKEFYSDEESKELVR
jgi:O-antigen ligase